MYFFRNPATIARTKHFFVFRPSIPNPANYADTHRYFLVREIIEIVRFGFSCLIMRTRDPVSEIGSHATAIQIVPPVSGTRHTYSCGRGEGGDAMRTRILRWRTWYPNEDIVVSWWSGFLRLGCGSSRLGSDREMDLISRFSYAGLRFAYEARHQNTQHEKNTISAIFVCFACIEGIMVYCFMWVYIAKNWALPKTRWLCCFDSNISIKKWAVWEAVGSGFVVLE